MKPAVFGLGVSSPLDFHWKWSGKLQMCHKIHFISLHTLAHLLDSERPLHLLQNLRLTLDAPSWLHCDCLRVAFVCVCVLIVDVASTRFCNGQKWYYPWNNQGLVDSSFRISLWKPGALEIRGSQHVELQGHINWSIILFDHFSCFIYGNCHFQGLKPPLLSSFLITTWSQCHENHHFLYGEGVWGIPQNYDLMEKCGWIAR